MWPWSLADPVGEAPHLVGIEVVDRDRDAGAAEAGDELGGLLDRLGPVVVGPQRCVSGAAAGADDRCARFAQGGGDAAAGAAGRSGDHGNAPRRMSAEIRSHSNHTSYRC